jgi:hypothetical protein
MTLAFLALKQPHYGLFSAKWALILLSPQLALQSV